MDAVTHIIKFNRQTAGRDRIYRLLQYTARFLKWYWLKHGASQSLVEKCRNLESALSLTRKAMRLGKGIDLLQGAMTSTKLHGRILRLCLVVGKLSQSCYLMVDHAVWAAKLGLISSDASRLNRIAAYFWLLAILSGLLRDILDIVAVARTELRKQQQEANDRQFVTGSASHRLEPVSDNSCTAKQYLGIVKRVTSHQPLVIDTVKNVADIFLPTATLGFVNTSEGFQGLMGMISSYMGILAIWDPALKLSPS